MREVPSDRFAFDPGRCCEGSRCFAFHRCAEHSVAGGGPCVGAGGNGGCLSRPGAPDRSVDAMSALAPGPSEMLLLRCEMRMPDQRSVEAAIVDQVCALVEPRDVRVRDAFLDGEHLDRCVQRLARGRERDDAARSEELIGQLDQPCSATQEGLLNGAVLAGRFDGMVHERCQRVGPREHRSGCADAVRCSE